MRSDIFSNGKFLANLYAALTVATFLNAIFTMAVKSVTVEGWAFAILSGGSANPILIFAVFWLAWMVWGSEMRPLKSRFIEVSWAAVVIVLILIPLSWFSWVGLTLAGARIALASERLRAVGLYISVPGFWALVATKFIGVPLLNLDAFVSSRLAGYASEGNFIMPDDGNVPIVVLWPCSSFHGLSYMVLAWLVFSAVQKVTPWRNLHLLAIGVFGVMVINWARLVSMTRFSDHFDSIHHGSISQLIAMITLVWMAGISMYATSLNAKLVPKLSANPS